MIIMMMVMMIITTIIIIKKIIIMHLIYMVQFDTNGFLIVSACVAKFLVTHKASIFAG